MEEKIKKLEENLKKAKTMLLSNADLLDANADILENCEKKEIEIKNLKDIIKENNVSFSNLKSKIKQTCQGENQTSLLDTIEIAKKRCEEANRNSGGFGYFRY